MAFANEAFSYQGSVTAIHQHSNEKQIQSNNSLSADLGVYYQAQKGHWHLHLEASSTPNKRGVAAALPNSNADSGSSLNDRDQGRVQLSELLYLLNATDRLQISAGLVDATFYLDTANIMNDENQNFISATLVNNPVIDFPDYVIGGALQYQFTPEISTRAFISSTHGIADNNSRNYSSLFEVNEDDKGLFSAIELGYASNQVFMNAGIWLHSGEHEPLDNRGDDDLSNYGSYVSAGWQTAPHQYEIRVGFANPDVSVANKFVSAAYQYSTNDWNLGLGFSSTTLSTTLEDKFESPAQTAEVYWQKHLTKQWHITPSVQWFKKPLYESDNLELDSQIMTANLRVSYAFE